MRLIVKLMLAAALFCIITIQSLAQNAVDFSSPYRVVIAADTFHPVYCVKGNAHRECPDLKKLLMSDQVNAINEFCLVDSVRLGELDSLLRFEFKLFKEGNLLPISKIVLLKIEPDGKERTFIIQQRRIAHPLRRRYLPRISAGCKVTLKTFWFEEQQSEKMIASRSGWIIR